MKIKLKAIYHDEDSGKPELEMDLLSRNELSIPFRLWLLPRYWPRLELTLVVKLKEVETDETEPGPFTVEARAEGVGEQWADALAVRLSQMGLTVWIKQLDITPEQGDD